MNLEKHEFKAVSMAMPVDNVLLKEAVKRGYYNGGTKWEHYFGCLFFDGGTINLRDDKPVDFIQTALLYLKHFMASFEPKHEEKTAICALILSEICIHPDDVEAD